MCTQAHTYINKYVHNIHRHIYTYRSPVYIQTQYVTCKHKCTYTHTHVYINASNPSPTPNMQLMAGYLQLKIIFKSYQKAKSNSNIQINDIKKSFYPLYY